MGGGMRQFNQPTASTDENGFYRPPTGIGGETRGQAPPAGTRADAGGPRATPSPTQRYDSTQDVIFNGSARDTNAAITRAQWADYLKRFQPLEGELQGGLTFNVDTGQQNHQMIGANVVRAKEAVGAAFDANTQARDRALTGMGVAPDPGQQSSIQRATAISKAASLVDAENMTRNRLAERNQEIALGSITSSGRSY